MASKIRCTKDELTKKFFKRRFNRQPKSDPLYFKEWKSRMKSSHPESYMDKKSKEVWRKVKSECQRSKTK